jgi:hypothetical protein
MRFPPGILYAFPAKAMKMLALLLLSTLLLPEGAVQCAPASLPSCINCLRDERAELGLRTVAGDENMAGVERWVHQPIREALRAAQGAVVRLSLGDASFLHVGHARVALLADYVARSCNGSLLVRFESGDADMPADGDSAALNDLATLGVRVDQTSCATDHVHLMLSACEQAIRDGWAYVDACTVQELSVQKLGACAHRQSAVSENLARWAEMLAGSVEFCVRARLDRCSPNPLLRDPVLFFCSTEGEDTKVCCRPTRAFSVPLLDHAHNVSFVLLSSRPAGRAAQYKAISELIGRQSARRPPQIRRVDRMLEFEGVPLKGTFLRHLASSRLVQGYDDTRLPTVGGLLRQGLAVEALRVFALLNSGVREDAVDAASEKAVQGMQGGLGRLDSGRLRGSHGGGRLRATTGSPARRCQTRGASTPGGASQESLLWVIKVMSIKLPRRQAP